MAVSGIDAGVRSGGAEPALSVKTALVASVVGAVVSTIVTVIAFLIVEAAGMIPDSVPIERFGGETSAIGGGDAFGMMMTVTIPAIVLYVLLARFSSRPRRIFTIVAAVITVLSFVSPVLQIDDVPAKMVIGLNILHVIAAVMMVGVTLLLSDPDRSIGRAR